jgi:hypothetical protein
MMYSLILLAPSSIIPVIIKTEEQPVVAQPAGVNNNNKFLTSKANDEIKSAIFIGG